MLDFMQNDYFARMQNVDHCHITTVAFFRLSLIIFKNFYFQAQLMMQYSK